MFNNNVSATRKTAIETMASMVNSEFNKHFERMTSRGFGIEEATMKALTTIFYTWGTVGVKFEDERLNTLYAEVAAKVIAEEDAEFAKRYIEQAALSYHEVGVPFTVNFKNGTSKRLVACECNGCKGCIFARTRFEKVVDRFEGVTSCQFKNAGRHALCKALVGTPNHTDVQVRADGKNVIFKEV